MEGRCEYKYLLDKMTADALRTRIAERLTPDENSKGLPYVISSLYFDSSAHKLYFQTLDRSVYRYKLRLRVYGESNSSDSISFFEIKSKLDGLSTKRRLKLPLAVNEQLWSDRTLPEELKPHDLKLARDILFLLDTDRLAPTSIVSYERLAYCRNDESRLRVTFDTKLRIRTNDLDLRHGTHGTPIMNDECILEVKSCSSIPLWLTRLIGEYRLANTSYSKYGKTLFNNSINKEKLYV